MKQPLSEPSTEGSLPAPRRTWYAILFYWILAVLIVAFAVLLPVMYFQQNRPLPPRGVEDWVSLLVGIVGPPLFLKLAVKTFDIARGRKPIPRLGKARKGAIANGLMTGIGCGVVALATFLQVDKPSWRQVGTIIVFLLGSVGGWCLVLRAWDEGRQERQARA